MKIAMISSEANPFIRKGGLADVVYSLSKQLVNLNNEVFIFLPYYESIRFQNLLISKVCEFDVNLSWRNQHCVVYQIKSNGISYYFVSNNYYFDRSNVYGYADDGERFAFFVLAVRKLMDYIHIKFDVIHCHDWQTAMLPVLIKELSSNDSLFKKVKYVTTIHNESFQGMLDRFYVEDFFGLPTNLYDSGKLRLNNMFCTLKSGLEYSDFITTVSKTHRDELLYNSICYGLDSYLEMKKDSFVGIVNGIDAEEYNPQTDEFIFRKFSEKSLTIGKKYNKKELLRIFNLDENFSGPVFSMVTKLSWKKGIELLCDIGGEIIEKGGVICIQGYGEFVLEGKLEQLRDKYPGKIGLYIGNSKENELKIYAGSDFFLMPSLFEPCGTGQMCAKAYGSIPVVRKVGGLADTIIPYRDENSVNADGISFNDYDIDGIRYAINKAFELYSNKEKFKLVRMNAFKADHSWKKSAKEYLKLYRW